MPQSDILLCFDPAESHQQQMATFILDSKNCRFLIEYQTFSACFIHVEKEGFMVFNNKNEKSIKNYFK